MTDLRFALDVEADIAHAFVTGQSVTLCGRPTEAHQLEESLDGVGRTTSLCAECRHGYPA